MKKLNLLIVVSLLHGITYGQIYWVKDLKSAQALSLAQGNFIVMDFWASWCGPCLTMDQELWSREDVAALSHRFVPLKVDIEAHPGLFQKYGANAIPKVVIADVAGNVLWEQVGYRNAEMYLDILQNLPRDVKVLNQNLLPVLQESDQVNDHINIAYAYQNLGKETTYSPLKSAFLRLSSMYFKKAGKKSDDVMVSETAELHLALNEAYAGNAKRALKRAEKLGNLTTEESNELKKFIQAYCYQCDGQTQMAEELKQEIKNKKYLAELENNP